MEIGLRILALMIDFIFCYFLSNLVTYSTGFVMQTVPDFFAVTFSPLLMGAFILVPVVYFAIPTGLWGRTPGKFILRLKVEYCGKPPGIMRALGRETLKLLSIACPLGILFNLCQICYTGSVWYDDLCGTGVTHSPLVKLTQTQKNWRKIMKQK